MEPAGDVDRGARVDVRKERFHDLGDGAGTPRVGLPPHCQLRVGGVFHSDHGAGEERLHPGRPQCAEVLALLVAQALELALARGAEVVHPFRAYDTRDRF